MQPRAKRIQCATPLHETRRTEPKPQALRAPEAGIGDAPGRARTNLNFTFGTACALASFGGACARRGLLRARWKVAAKGGSPSGRAVHGDVPAAASDDFPDDGEAEPRATTGRLGREKRLEDVLERC